VSGHHGTVLKGKLLVANPALRDPNFDRTVVLVLEHTEEGALGLVLNRPSETTVDDVLPQWDRLAAEPTVVFVGGPVQPSAAICVGRLNAADGEEPEEGWKHLFMSLATVDLERDPDELAELERVRVFAGYAGWGPGQLEGELEAEGWFVFDALPDDALSERAEDLWRLVLRRQGGRFALLSTFPPDPSAN
jgi:putative transcriptional regulator